MWFSCREPSRNSNQATPCCRRFTVKGILITWTLRNYRELLLSLLNRKHSNILKLSRFSLSKLGKMDMIHGKVPSQEDHSVVHNNSTPHRSLRIICHRFPHLGLRLKRPPQLLLSWPANLNSNRPLLHPALILIQDLMGPTLPRHLSQRQWIQLRLINLYMRFSDQ